MDWETFDSLVRGLTPQSRTVAGAEAMNRLPVMNDAVMSDWKRRGLQKAIAEGDVESERVLRALIAETGRAE